MPDTQLKAQLEQLHQALSSGPELDDESRELLSRIAGDIDSLDIDADDTSDLSDLIQEQAIRFDQEHPALSATLRQLIDTLGRMGV
ncbi:DUF4404 family protein [Thalassolituus sp.]|uniref:DUF4404 family protein n=1 Tax=Thalassolituus sp. TaxID=2030822 RepID=UPI002618EADB|nr:DUF4404 family protein [uncultured Thalassolituus sp.]TNC93055.1 MAG: chromosome partitioning protein ParA [Thalassolituus sp.]